MGPTVTTIGLSWITCAKIRQLTTTKSSRYRRSTGGGLIQKRANSSSNQRDLTTSHRRSEFVWAAARRVGRCLWSPLALGQTNRSPTRALLQSMRRDTMIPDGDYMIATEHRASRCEHEIRPNFGIVLAPPRPAQPPLKLFSPASSSNVEAAH